MEELSRLLTQKKPTEILLVELQTRLYYHVNVFKHLLMQIVLVAYSPSETGVLPNLVTIILFTEKCTF